MKTLETVLTSNIAFAKQLYLYVLPKESRFTLDCEAYWGLRGERDPGFVEFASGQDVHHFALNKYQDTNGFSKDVAQEFLALRIATFTDF